MLATGIGALAGCANRDHASQTATVRPAAQPAASAPHDSSAPEVRPADANGILAAVRQPGARAVFLNVWASWCVPCREEFPELMAFVRAHQADGLRPVLVSADFDEQLPDARAFLAQNGVTFPSYLKTGKDMAFIDTLDPRWTGALPATFLYDGTGQLRYFHEGKVTRALLEEQLKAILNAPTKPKQEERS